jgi:hypothetical protein
MRIRYIWFVLNLVLPFTVFGQQPGSFSNSYEQFIKELDEILTTSKRDDYIDLSKEFTKAWTSEYIDAQRDIIIRSMNEMRKRRLTVYPYYGNYLEVLTKLRKNEASSQYFYDWHLIYQKVLELNQRSIDLFQKSSADFYEGSYVYVSPNIKWQVLPKSFKFEVDNGQIQVSIPECDLRCFYFQDSVVIKKTSGVWNIVDQKWVGVSGIVDWQRARFPTDSVFAELNNYTVQFKNFGYQADSVRLYNKAVGRWMFGQLQDRCTANLTEELITYPRFTSYEGEIKLDQVFKNVTIRGKYALSGNRYLAIGTREKPAEVFIYRNDTTTVRAWSSQFAIRKTDVFSSNAEVNVVLNKDSIYHPGINMRFTTADRRLLLFLEPNSINKIPFSNSYHKLDTYCEALSWKIDEPYIDFKMQTGKSEAIAIFTSKDFFDKREYLAVQGYATYNPVVRVYQYSRQIGAPTFRSDGFAAYMKLPVDAIRQLLIDMANQGFIYYDRDEETITTLKKLAHYYDAIAGRIDYDVVKLVSKSDKENNARLNIATRELEVKGVSVVMLSDTHTVFAVPYEQKVIVEANRTLKFSGHVHSGTLDFYGDGFTFDYEKFRVNMQNVDSMRFQVLTGSTDVRGVPVLAKIENALENITGVLYLDDPRNKSSRVPLYRYPYFESKQESYVYFDKLSIQKGRYTRDKFYFKVDPFVLDSLDFMGATSRLSLNGTLVSGGIFPDIKEKLRFQDDLSLGFAMLTNDDGIPIYNKATYNKNITLDARGLHGYGKISYRNTVVISNDFIFLPDTTTGQTESFDITGGEFGGVSYASISGKEAGMLWAAKADSMTFYRGLEPLDAYSDIASFSGDLVYTPEGLFGNGFFQYGRDRIHSGKFVMEEKITSSERLRLELASNTESVLAVQTEELKGTIDFPKRIGQFMSLEGLSRILMPLHEFSARVNDLEWDMKNNFLVLGTKADLSKPQTVFRSENPAQDGLQFYGGYGQLDLNIFQLDVKGVPEVKSADAIIYPDSAQLVIEPRAKIRKLVNANLLADSSNRTHKVYKANVELIGRKAYEADGFYDYVNSSGARQSIFLNLIKPDRQGITTASGNISPDSNFVLNPGFGFSGSVTINANKKELSWQGLVKLIELPDTVLNGTFRYSGLFDPSLDYIKVPEFKDELNRRLYTGVYINLSGSRVYPVIGAFRWSMGDSMIMDVSGIVQYQAGKRTYKIGSEDRLLKDSKLGSIMTIDLKQEFVRAEGQLNLGFRKEDIRLVAAGELTHRYNQGTTDILLVAMVDMLLPDPALKMMNNSLLDNAFGAPDVNLDQEYVTNAFIQLMDEKDADRIIADIQTQGTIPVMNSTDFTFIFSNLDLSWDSATKSFRSKETLGLSLLNGETVNKRLNGIFEIQYLPNTRILNFLFEPTEAIYFLYTYRAGRVTPISSVMEFNEFIKKGLGKKKKKGIDNRLSLGITQNRDRLVARQKNTTEE